MSNQNPVQDSQHFKIIIIGEAGVGKSCMMMRYMNQQYLSDYSATIGVEFQSKKVTLENGQQVNVQIWDTAGQESFRAIVKTFYRNSHAILIVYNVAKKKTFQECDNWLNESSQNAHPNALKILVGTQSDRDDREVTTQEGEAYKESRNYDLFFETSAKTGDNIDKVFQEVTKNIYDKFSQINENSGDEDKQDNAKLKNNKKENKKEGGCC